jgi:hypothetical protein
MSNMELASHIGLWVFMLVLYGAVFLLYRYLGDRVRTRGEKPIGPPVGEPIAPINLQTVQGTSLQIGLTTYETQVLFFAAAGCKACDKVSSLLAALTEQHRHSVETVVIFAGGLDQAITFSQKLPKHVRVVVDSESSVARGWKIGITPFVMTLRGIDGVLLLSDIAGREINLKYAFNLRATENAVGEIPVVRHAT